MVAHHSIIRQHVHAAKANPATKKALTVAADSAYGKEPVFVHMYGSWCPHCVSMTDAMNSALSALRRGAVMAAPSGYKVTVLQMESALLADKGEDSSLVSDLRGLGRPGGYPYIALVGRDAGVQEHLGDRSAHGLTAFFLDALQRELQRCGPTAAPPSESATIPLPAAAPRARKKASPGPRKPAAAGVGDPGAKKKRVARSPRARRQKA